MTLIAVTDGVPEANVQQTWLNVRELTDDEMRAIQAANRLFHDLLEASPLAELKKNAEDLGQSVIDFLHDEHWTFSPARQQVHTRFKSWLGAVRTFDDRTSHWISTTFGKDHPAYDAFKTQLSTEYDNNFAYRFACALRNVSEHVSQTINVVRTNETELPDGRTRRALQVGFDRHLAADLRTLKSQIRTELAGCEGVIPLETLAGHAMASCERAYGRALLSLWPECEVQVATIEGLHREAVSRGGYVARAVDLERFHEQRMTTVEIRDDLARVLRNVQGQVSALLAVPPSTLRAVDLVRNDTMTATI